MTSAALNTLAERVHIANKKWWLSLETGEAIKRNFGELMMLTTSELAEAMEGHRKSLDDDKLPHRQMFEVELADALIRLLDVCGGMGIPISSGYAFYWKENVAEQLMQLNVMVVRAYWCDEDGRLVDRDDMLCMLISGIVSLAERHKLDLMGAFEDKMHFNAHREDHKAESRKKAGGKKY